MQSVPPIPPSSAPATANRVAALQSETCSTASQPRNEPFHTNATSAAFRLRQTAQIDTKTILPKCATTRAEAQETPGQFGDISSGRTELSRGVTTADLAQRVEFLERRLAIVEAGGTLAEVVPLLIRIADAIAPAPVTLVGTPYVAKQLGCTTVWVAEMARRGEIPKNCVVPGTGTGKLWKFYRDRIDRWVTAR